MAKKSKKLRVAIIGCGSICRHRHLPEYASRPDVEVVALVDIKLDRARDLAATYGVKNVFADYKDALALQPDLVSVCTPNVHHGPMTLDALNAGAHVLCEKPMAGSMAEARKMIATAKKNGKQLMIGHNQRFAAGHRKGKELYKSGLLGKCLTVRTTFGHGGPETWSADGLQPHFFRKAETLMGTLADLGVHKVDLVRWLLEDEITHIGGFCGTLAKKNCDVDDNAVAVFRTKGGALGMMHASWTHAPGEDNSTILYCDKGILKLETDRRFSVIAEVNKAEKYFIEAGKIQTNEEGGQVVRSGVIDGFVEAIRKNKPVPVPGEEGARSLAVVLACVQAAQNNTMVEVEKL